MRDFQHARQQAVGLELDLGDDRFDDHGLDTLYLDAAHLTNGLGCLLCGILNGLLY